MQYNFKKTFLALSISLCIAPVAYATNGLAPTGLGQVHKAMGGAAVGNPQNTTTMMTNPAAASFVNNGYDVALELFRPDRSISNNTAFSPPDNPRSPPSLPPYDTLNPQGSIAKGDSYSGNGKMNFIVPEAAAKFTRGRFAIGISAYGNGGMNTQYNKSPAFAADGLSAEGMPAGRPDAIDPATNQPYMPDGKLDSVFNFNSTEAGPVGTTGVNLEQLFIAPTISTKISPRHSVGLSLNLVVQRFEAKGLSALKAGSDSPEKFTDQGKSTATGVGATIGWMGQLSNKFTAGASYRLKTKMGKFKEYAGLFPNQGEMNVPAALTVGGSMKVTPRTTIAADVQRIFYSDVAATGNAFAQRGFGGKDGPGFGWQDQTVIKLGIKQQIKPNLAVMAGFNHGDSPVGAEDTFFNALTPAVVENHLSLGFDYGMSKTSSIVGSYTHTFENTVKGAAQLGQPYDLTMSQNAVGLGFSKKF